MQDETIVLEPDRETEPGLLGRFYDWMRLIAGSKAFSAAFALVMVAIAILFIHDELRHHPWSSIVAATRTIPLEAIVLALALVVSSYAALAANEALALTIFGARQPLTRVVAGAGATYAVGNGLGFSFATAVAVRLRFYTAWGLGPREVAGVSTLTGVLVPLGGITAAGLGALAASPELAARSTMPLFLVLALAVLALVPAAAWLMLVRTELGAPSRAKIAGLEVERPGLRRGALGLALSALDWIAAAGVLFVLLPEHGSMSFPAFLAVFVAAGLLGAISGAPGGLGVFEATVLALTPQAQANHGVAGALLVYRALYTLLPLAVTAMGVSAAALPRLVRTPAARSAGSVALALSPPVFATLTFVSGALMLLSGATPGLAERLAALHRALPLPITELSHFFASVVGLLLFFVAAGLWRRLDGAYIAALVLLFAGAAFSLLKGIDVEEATLLAVLGVLLLPCRPAFVRKSRLRADVLSGPWLAAAVGVVGAVVWLGLLSYRHVPYGDEMWWTFVREGEAARSLRATTGAILLLAALSLATLIGPARAGRRAGLAEADLVRARAAIAGAEAPLADAHLALAGDKRLLFSESGKSFIMYATRASRWIAMSEPVGLLGERTELLYRFREQADAESALPVFYSITAALLPDMVDQGYLVRKIGETAVVPLTEFSLEGKARGSLRTARNKAQKLGLTFTVLMPDDPATPWERLDAVSKAWLAHHHGREKHFSLGSFDRRYLANFPIAMLTQQGTVLAFANLWPTADKRIISVDLMRHAPDAPNGTMDALFVELMLWAKTQGYREFDLGMAPLAGLENRRFAPLLTRIGAFVFERGESLYGFQGLRSYKDKFLPIWRPLYAAAPPGVLMPVALADVALLTSGGWRGLFK